MPLLVEHEPVARAKRTRCRHSEVNDEPVDAQPPRGAFLVCGHTDESHGELAPDPVQIERTARLQLGSEKLDLQCDELDIDTQLLQSGAEADDALPVDAGDLDIGGREIYELHGGEPGEQRRTPRRAR